MIASHTDSSWRWHLDRRDGRLELAWVHERGVWLKRFRPCDPDGSPGGWTDPQRVALDAPADEADAAGIAEAHARGLT